MRANRQTNKPTYSSHYCELINPICVDSDWLTIGKTSRHPQNRKYIDKTCQHRQRKTEPRPCRATCTGAWSVDVGFWDMVVFKMSCYYYYHPKKIPNSSEEDQRVWKMRSSALWWHPTARMLRYLSTIWWEFWVVRTYVMLSGSLAHCPTARVTLTSSAGLVPVSRLISSEMAFILRSSRRLFWSLASSDNAPTTFTNT